MQTTLMFPGALLYHLTTQGMGAANISINPCQINMEDSLGVLAKNIKNNKWDHFYLVDSKAHPEPRSDQNYWVLNTTTLETAKHG